MGGNIQVRHGIANGTRHPGHSPVHILVVLAHRQSARIYSRRTLDRNRTGTQARKTIGTKLIAQIKKVSHDSLRDCHGCFLLKPSVDETYEVNRVKEVNEVKIIVL